VAELRRRWASLAKSISRSEFSTTPLAVAVAAELDARTGCAAGENSTMLVVLLHGICVRFVLLPFALDLRVDQLRDHDPR
jgi:hypothetical protein